MLLWGSMLREAESSLFSSSLLPGTVWCSITVKHPLTYVCNPYTVRLHSFFFFSDHNMWIHGASLLKSAYLNKAKDHLWRLTQLQIVIQALYRNGKISLCGICSFTFLLLLRFPCLCLSPSCPKPSWYLLSSYPILSHRHTWPGWVSQCKRVGGVMTAIHQAWRQRSALSPPTPTPFTAATLGTREMRKRLSSSIIADTQSPSIHTAGGETNTYTHTPIDTYVWAHTKRHTQEERTAEESSE